MRKLFGYFLGLALLSLYIIIVLRLSDAMLPQHIALEILYFAITGIGWIFPAMWLIRWWYRPKQKDGK